MTKKDCARALAARHEMSEKGVTLSQIMRFATTPEVHGYYKGVFFPSGQPANLYVLAARIRERQKAGKAMTRHRPVMVRVPYRLVRH